MPFEFELIAKADPKEQQLVYFSNDDLQDTHQLEKLRVALNAFQKLQFKFSETPTPQNKTHFINFTIKLLEASQELKEFDLSDNQFAVKFSNCSSISGRGTGRGVSGRVKLTRTREIRYATDDSTFDDLLAKLLSSYFLKSIVLQNNSLFSKDSNLVNVCGAISKGYEKIDLRNTYSGGDSEKKCFTLEQLFALVKTLKTENSECQIIISFDELPQTVQTVIHQSDSVNLTEIAEKIYGLYRKERFDETIESIKNSKNNAIKFEWLLDELTEQETQQFADALKQNSQISTLTLPSCHFASLTPALKNHSSILQLNISALVCDDQVLNSLEEIFLNDSNIQHLICDYRLILQDRFKNVSDAILILDSKKNTKHKDGDKCSVVIELNDSSNILSTDLTAWEGLINKTKTERPDIKIVIDLSILDVGLQSELENQNLIPRLNESVYFAEDSTEEDGKREGPLFNVGGKDKLILTPFFETHSKVMECIVSSVAKKKAVQAANELLQQKGEEDAGRASDQARTPVNLPENSLENSSKNSTSCTSNTETQTQINSKDSSATQQSSSNTNQNSDVTPPPSVTSALTDSGSLMRRAQNVSDAPKKGVHSKLSQPTVITDQVVKLPTNLCITLSPELQNSFNALASFFPKNDMETNAIAKATQTLLDNTLGQFVKPSDSNSSPPEIDENKIKEAIAAYRKNVTNLSMQQQIVVAAATFLGILIGFIAGVLAGSLATGLNPIGALIAGTTGAIVGASIGAAAGGSIAFGLSCFGVFKSDPVKACAKELVEAIENSVEKGCLR